MGDYASVLADTVIFLFTEDSGEPAGTAFIVGYPVSKESDKVIPLIVTAKHVIGDQKQIVGRFSTKSGSETAEACYDLDHLRKEGDIWEHPDSGVDLIVFRTPCFPNITFIPYPIHLIASKDKFQEEEIKPTDRVIFPCLLVNFMGLTRNYPVIRDGSIALIPEEPVPLKYEVGTKIVNTEQQVILIDATAIPGASGSPVFLWPGPRLRRGAFTVGGTQPWLLGIIHGFYPAAREITRVQVSKVVPIFEENTGIAIMFPSWRLLEILECDNVVKRINNIIKAER